MQDSKQNLLKLKFTTFLEAALERVGNMVVNDVYTQIEVLNEESAEEYVKSASENIFETIEIYIQEAKKEYIRYSQTPEGIHAKEEYEKTCQEQEAKLLQIEAPKEPTEGEGNVH